MLSRCARGAADEADAQALRGSRAHHTLQIGSQLTRGLGSGGDPRIGRRAIEEDVAGGRVPIAVVSAVGTTGTTAVDPLEAISDVAHEFGLWHHVDAAYAGTAMVCEEFRRHQPGLDRVDS